MEPRIQIGVNRQVPLQYCGIELAEFIPTDLKIRVIDLLSEAGLRTIEATSFVNPRVIPQMADAAEVMRRIARRPGTAYKALVPSLEGAEQALNELGADGWEVTGFARFEIGRENGYRGILKRPY